jgi:hypothetical protein
MRDVGRGTKGGSFASLRMTAVFHPTPQPTTHNPLPSTLYQIVPRSRQLHASIRIGLREERLNDSDAADVEAMRGGRHVESPHAICWLTDERHRFPTSGLEAANPVTQREDVMLAQALDVAQLEPASLGAPDDRGGRCKLAIREDVSVDELATLPQSSRNSTWQRLSARPGNAHDAVIQEQAAGT